MYNTNNCISMDNRRQYDYLPKDENIQGIVGTWKGYDIQVVSLQPGDVLLVHISDDLDINSCKSVMDTLRETFPNNQCVLCNEHVLKGMTILQTGENKKINDKVNITTDVNIDELFENIMKGNSNDFLY